MSRCLIAAMVIAIGTAPASATDDWKYSGSLGVSVSNFSYREFTDSGALLDREEGALPSLLAGFSAAHAGWVLTAETSYDGSKLQYQGQTQTGTPLSTRTREEMLRALLTAGYRFNPEGNLVFGLYGGLGYLRWQRNILPSGQVRGLKETYRWNHAVLGAETVLHDGANQSWRADLRFNLPLNPSVDVDFGDLYDRTRIALGRQAGWRAAVEWSYVLDMGDTLALGACHERLRLGRSATATLARNGVAVGTVYEPNSETRASGLSMRWIRRF